MKSLAEWSVRHVPHGTSLETDETLSVWVKPNGKHFIHHAHYSVGLAVKKVSEGKPATRAASRKKKDGA